MKFRPILQALGFCAAFKKDADFAEFECQMIPPAAAGRSLDVIKGTFTRSTLAQRIRGPLVSSTGQTAALSG